MQSKERRKVIAKCQNVVSISLCMSRLRSESLASCLDPRVENARRDWVDKEGKGSVPNANLVRLAGV